MKISTILDLIDGGSLALPEFQRGYVWNREQVRGLMQSLYRRHPVGSLLVWHTERGATQHRGDGLVAPGPVKLILDGQQRITTLYGIIRGRPPRFFDGSSNAFTGLHFHLGDEDFEFYQPIKMGDDPLWIDVSALMQAGNDGLGEHLTRWAQAPESEIPTRHLVGRLNRILGIGEIDLHIEEVTGADKTIEVVVDIFNRVNSGGTKLSQGDLAMAKICADWPDARARIKACLARWKGAGYGFGLDWFLRCVNTIVTGEARFSHLHDVDPDRIEDGARKAEKHIDRLLNLIEGRLGLDHERVLFGRYAFPVMVHYLELCNGHLQDETERDRLLYWHLHSAMWGRFSGSTETVIDKDLEALQGDGEGLARLIAELRLWHGSLRVLPDHFGGWSLGARFYPVLYLLTRVDRARDWGTGIELRAETLGKGSNLEVHHIFPKAKLYDRGFVKAQVNAVANYCFQTKETNQRISDTLPELYFPEIEARHPGALASQWIPTDPALWRIDRYLDFLAERKRLLADAANAFLDGLLHEAAPAEPVTTPIRLDHEAPIPGGIETAEEEARLHALSAWVNALGLPEGEMSYEMVDPNTGRPIAILDLAWPNGLQVGLSEPVAVLLDEGPELLRLANARGFRYFSDIDRFKAYVEREVLAMAVGGAVLAERE